MRYTMSKQEMVDFKVSFGMSRERAEFECIRNGAKREAIPEDPLAAPSYGPADVAEPTPISGDGASPKTDGGTTPAPQPK